MVILERFCQFWSDFPFAVDIVHIKGASFIDATTAVEADAKQSAIVLCLKPATKEQLNFQGFEASNFQQVQLVHLEPRASA